MKKDLCLIILSALLALLPLGSTTPAAFAVATRATASHLMGISEASREQGSAEGRRPTPINISRNWGYQENNQSHRGNSFSGLHLDFLGHNQNNEGNQGVNTGRHVGFGANGGNELVNRHWTGVNQRNNQYREGNSYSFSSGRFRGYNQENIGNQGINWGDNQNYGPNSGNQVVTFHRTGARQQNNQYFRGNSDSFNRGLFRGHNQDNDGNQGFNGGDNQNYGSNGGNQIVN